MKTHTITLTEEERVALYHALTAERAILSAAAVEGRPEGTRASARRRLALLRSVGAKLREPDHGPDGYACPECGGRLFQVLARTLQEGTPAERVVWWADCRDCGAELADHPSPEAALADCRKEPSR